LIEAINDYEGACILVSHDRRLLEACVDRLWLAANGTVQPFEGDLADYSRFVLSGAERPPQQKAKRETQAAAAPKPKREPQPIKREIAALEEKLNRFHDLLRRIDDALAQASARKGDAAKMTDLAAKRAELERTIIATEKAWFELTAEVEQT
jgi:ATP-binding cassette subfamily F protein 3